MGKLRYRILRLFKKKYFVALIIIFAFIFSETSYKFIVKLGSNLVEAEDILGKKGIQVEEMEVYENYGKNRKLFNRKVKEMEEQNNLGEIQDEGKEETDKAINEVADESKDIDVESETNRLDEGKQVVEEKPEVVETDESKEGIEQESEETVPEENSKIAYLTFDDGPSSTVTPKILDILAQYDVKATFFVVGKFAEKNPDILIRTYQEGHVIGNHSYSHNYNYIYKNVSNFVQELNITQEVFKSILGKEFETDLIRFPGGSFGDWKSSFREQVIELGYRYIDWNSLNGDAEGHNLSRDKLIERFKSTYRNQQEIVILMHDTDAKATTVEALPAIIEFLIEEGYQFATF